MTPSADASEDSLVLKPSQFQISYRLDAAVVSSTAVGFDVPAGMRLNWSDGLASSVHAGAVVGRLVADPRAAGSLGTGTVGKSRRAATAAREATVRAPVDGGVVRGGTPGIAKQGLDLAADLSPLQVLRYESSAFTGEASVETTLGQQHVACVAVWITPGKESGGGARVHCRLPDSVETTAGIPGVLGLRTAAQRSALAIPVRYVGLDATGRDYVVQVSTGSSTRTQPVTVGATDGVRRVLTSGVAAGVVLVPIPEP